MSGDIVLETPRLLLRHWRAEDRLPFARLNADPRVMEFFPALLSSEQSNAMIGRMEAAIGERGFGLWAAELRSTGELAGFVGLSVPGFQAHFTPCVEIGWRLAAAFWGQGLATEAARAAVYYGFHTVGLAQIVSFAVPANLRSRRVMEKLGMQHEAAEDFDHPSLPEGHILRRHVLYRLNRPPG
jgi:RimJ/RimL family protein N-acetyltransferase